MIELILLRQLGLLVYVLHDEREVERDLKIKYSEASQDKYIENLDDFIDLICNSDFTVKWDIKKAGTL